MILTGKQIELEVIQGRVIIDPFDPTYLNPNSYNFRLGKSLTVYTDSHIDPRFPARTETIEINDQGYELQPNRLYLGYTLERMGSTDFIPLIGGRSSTGRLGLFVHITAPLGDIGYIGQWTLQFRSTIPVKIYPGQKIGQIIFILPYGPVQLYRGKYQHGSGAQPYRPVDLFGSTTIEANAYAETIEFYDTLPDELRKELNNEMQFCISKILSNKERIESFIDVGCGVGLLLSELEQISSVQKIIGIDFSPRLIHYCLKKCTRSLLICGDFFYWDFQDLQYDAMSMLAFLHLFPAKYTQQIIEKAHNLLNHNGLLLVSTSIHESYSEDWEEKKSIQGIWRYRVRHTKETWLHLFDTTKWKHEEYWVSDEILDKKNQKKWQYLLLKKI